MSASNTVRPVGEIPGMTTPPNFDATHRHNVGSLPQLDKLQSDSALLRRIAYNTDVARSLLGWLLATAVLGIIAAVIVGVVLILHTPAPASAPAACDSTVSTC